VRCRGLSGPAWKFTAGMNFELKGRPGGFLFMAMPMCMAAAGGVACALGWEWSKELRLSRAHLCCTRRRLHWDVAVPTHESISPYRNLHIGTPC
jgi:hypothetical protein